MSKGKEYIERELAIQATCNLCPLLHDCIGDDCANRNVVRAIPAADVVEVRHGTWYKAKDGYTRCSRCDSRGSAIKARYCHHCGAKMDGGNDNA